MVWIKICGITNTGDAEAAVRCGTDALGFVFSTDSPRRISLEAAGGIMDHLRDIPAQSGRENTGGKGNRIRAVEKVGVFVNEDPGKITSFTKELRLDRVQLSGDESPGYIKRLKEIMPDIRVIKAIRIGSDDRDHPEHSRGDVKRFETLVDNILMDSYHPDKYGGTGKTLEPGTAKRFGSMPGFILSGGLDHLNIGEAIRSVGPYGIDASSRLESSPGKKDHELIKSFIEAARQAAGVEHG